MSAHKYNGFVLETFNKLYREVVIQKEAAHHATPEQTQHTFIQQRLRTILEDYALTAQTRVTDFASSHYQEAMYVMVALCDEIFLSFEWAGQQEWENHLLEAQFFKTQIAGEQFFRNLDSLLKDNDPVRNDIAVVYLMAICLGFRGKFRGDADPRLIIHYKDHLFSRVMKERSTLYDPGREHLISFAYANTQNLPYSRGLPDLKRWFLVFFGIVIVYLFLSSSLWFGIVHDLNTLTDDIIRQSQQIGAL